MREGVRISFFCLMYVGLFTAPLLPLLVLKSQRDPELSRKKSLVATALIVVLLTAKLIRIGDLMPIWRNVLDKGGIGLYPMIKSETLRAPEFVLKAVTGLSLLGGTAVDDRLISAALAVYSRFSQKVRRLPSLGLDTITQCFSDLLRAAAFART